MTIPLLISGKAGSGKTAVALSLAMKLQDKGYRLSYFKPQGFQEIPSKREDDDVQLMKQALSLSYPGDTLSPVLLNPFYLSAQDVNGQGNYLEKIDQAYEKISQNSDVVLIEGSITPFIGHGYGMDDFSLAKRLGAAIIPVLKADDDFELDNALGYLRFAQLSNIPVAGCIFNNVAPEQWDVTHSIYKEMITDVPLLGIMPRRKEISTPTAREFYMDLGGEVLVGEEYLDRKVENVVIGTMTIDSALSYLRRSINKAVITGGDRSDMALTALETNTSLLILTGGLYPDVKVLSKAEEKEVPIILVHYDTYTTVENLHHIYRSIHPDNKKAFEILRKDSEVYLELESLYKYIKEKSS